MCEDLVSPVYLVEKPKYLNEGMNEGCRHSVSSTESCFRRCPRDLMEEEDGRKRGQGEGQKSKKTVSKFCAVGSWFKSLQLPELQVTHIVK